MKALVAELEKRRGHKITIAARVESDPEMALNHSMDWTPKDTQIKFFDLRNAKGNGTMIIIT